MARGQRLATARRRAAVDSGHTLAIDSGAFGPGWHEQADASIKPKVFMGGLDKLVAMVESSDPVISGTYLTAEETMSPPLHTRAALDRKAGLGAGWAENILGRVEALEGFKLTQYTPLHLRADLLRAARDDGEMRGLLANKRLSRPEN